MKKFMKRIMGIVAALAVVATAVAGTGIAAQAATVTVYDWQYIDRNGNWSEVPVDMRKAIEKLDYTGTTFTITSAGEVDIWGATGEITVIQAMDSSGNLIGNNLLVDGEAVLYNVASPVYVYFEITLDTGTHTEVYTKFIF